MQGAAILVLSLLGGGVTDYARPLDAKALDRPTFDAETYGDKKKLAREADGLHLKLSPGDPETGWKTPQNVRFGGDFTIVADFVVKTLPKPAQEDGAAVGVAIAYQDINHPDLTLVRLREPSNADVYLAIDKATANPNPNQMMMVNNGMGMVMVRGGMVMGQNPGAKPPKPPRHTFPAAGETFRLELKREGNVIRYQALDAKTGQPRYLGQVASQGPMDVAAIKLFATNRNGAEPIDVVLRGLTVHADRVTGLGTVIRTIRGHLVYGDPTGIADGKLLVGGPAGNAPGGAPGPQPAGPRPAPAPPGATPAAPAAMAVPAGAVVVAAAPAGAVVVVARAVPAAPAGQVAVPPPAAPAPPATAPRPGDNAPKPANAQNPAKPPPKPEPKAKVPLDEVESIHFERNPSPGGRFLGQPNLDLTMPGLSAKKDDKPAEAKDKKDDKPKDAKPEEKPKGEANNAKPDEKVKAAQDAAKAKLEEKAKGEAKPEEKAKDAKENAKPDEKAKAEKGKDERPEDAKPAEKKDEKAKDKKDEKKSEADDALAPPPGTAEAPKATPKLDPKPNGIRDVHLWLFGLREAPIKQVTVNCQTDGGPTSWRLDTSNSQDWPLVLKRAGNGPTADLFLEPPSKDSHQKDYNVTINYGDGQMANIQVKANGHTDNKLAFDPKSPSASKPDARVFLVGGEQVFGKLDAIGEENLTLMIPWKDSFEVPLARVVGVQLSTPDSKEPAASFAKRLKDRGPEDLLLARTKDGEVVAIAGVVEGSQGDRLKFRYQDKTRTLLISVVEGLVMAERPDPPSPTSPLASFTLPGGVVLSASWKDVDGANWKVETPWGVKFDLPSNEVQEVRFRGGKMTFLSDLKPSKVEEAPFFGRRLPWRADASLLGGPLKVGGKGFDRGVAVHSRCVLTYDLGGRFEMFEALVGFDDAAGGKGRADVRVLADGKEIFANPDLRADKDPVKLELPVAGAGQLRLVVDFGQGEDTGDRVIWADARLYRRDDARKPEKAADRRK